MASTIVNVVSDSSPDISLLNIEMVEVENGSANFSNNNNVVARSLAPVETLLKMAANNGGKDFNIFISSLESKSIPKRSPRDVQSEILAKIEHSKKIDNVRFTRTGSVIFSTKDVTCAVDISRISTFLGVNVTSRVIWENITNRFLLFNIPVNVSLEELAQEIEDVNNINIIEMRRFIKKDNKSETSPVLITSLGTFLPNEIKIWFSVQRIRQFIDRPRQCNNCYKFNHNSSRCNSDQLCATCGKSHKGTCNDPLSCVNCGAGHRADYNQCPFRLQEAEFLKFKCQNFLSFVDARRKFSQKSEAKSYAKVTQIQKTESEDFQKILDSRTNNMLKVIVDISSKHYMKITEAITELSKLLTSCLAQLNNFSPERRKRTNHGSNSQIT